MKKTFIMASAIISCMSMYAQDDTKTIVWPDGTEHTVKPVLKMQVEVDGESAHSFSLGSYKESDYYAVDFGDGNLVVTEEVGLTTSTATKTAVSGVAKGEGFITLYAEDDDIWYLSESAGTSETSRVKSVDVSGISKVQQLSISKVLSETIDLKGLESLTTFTSAKGELKTLDFSGNPELKTVNVAENKIKSIDVSKNANLTGLTCYTNEIESLDLSSNTLLEGLYSYGNKITSVKFAESVPNLGTINLQQNELTSIDLSMLTKKLSMCYFNDNNLTELVIPVEVATFEAKNNKIAKFSVVDATKSCALENNCLTLATLPTKPAGLNTASKIKKFTYAPQADIEVAKRITTEQVLDLSSQLKAQGELEEEATTTYTITSGEQTLVEGEDYKTVEPGKFQFLKAFAETVSVTMNNAAFPKFEASDALLKTTAFNVVTLSDDERIITGGDGKSRIVKPVLKMQVEVDGESAHSFSLGSYKESDYYAVDFGDGNLIVTEEVGLTTSTATKTAVSGVAKGEGFITLYAEDDDIWYLSESAGTSETSRVKSVDVSGISKVQQLSISKVLSETIDLKGLESLTTFTSAKGELKTLDFSGNPELKTLNVAENKLKTIDVSKNANLTGLTCYTNEIESLDLSSNTLLEGLYSYGNKITSVKFAESVPNLGTINLQQNELTSIDLSMLTKKLSMCYFNDNNLTELVIPVEVATFEAKNNKIAKFSVVDATKSCALENNCLTLATLPTKPAGLNTASKIKKFTYAPQADVEVAKRISTEQVLDLSLQLKAQGELEEEATTTYTITSGEQTLVEGEDYKTVEPGKFQFLKAFEETVSVTMNNAAFPKFEASDALLKTTAFNVVTLSDDERIITGGDGKSRIVKPVLKMQVEVDGESAHSFSLGSYKESDYYAVDFGDGNLVVTEEVGLTTSTATKTAVSGVAKGEGFITLYAEDDDIWYLSESAGTSETSRVKSVDVSGISKVQQLSISKVLSETIDLEGLESLTTFTSAKGELKTLDFSGNPELKTVNVAENKIKTIDVSKNANLTGLTCYTNEIESLDLSSNTLLEGLYSYGNKITSVKFAESVPNLGTINLQQNELTSIDLSMLTKKLSMCYFNDNNLTELVIPVEVATFEAKNNKIAKFSVVDATKSCALENNCLTLATLPTKPAGLNTASKIKKFTYAPQAAYVVEENYTADMTLDLSSQVESQGILEEKASTVFTVENADGVALVEGTDYEVSAPGQFKFLTSQESVRVVMATEAFPLFTADKAFATTYFSVSVVDAISNVDADAANNKTYNVVGIEVNNPSKGIFIKNGKKFLVK